MKTFSVSDCDAILEITRFKLREKQGERAECSRLHGRAPGRDDADLRRYWAQAHSSPRAPASGKVTAAVSRLHDVAPEQNLAKGETVVSALAEVPDAPVAAS